MTLTDADLRARLEMLNHLQGFDGMVLHSLVEDDVYRALLEELLRLREAVREAPHYTYCNLIMFGRNAPENPTCNCWKSALKEEGT